MSLTPAHSTAAVEDSDEIILHALTPWTGDLDGMARRGFLRILTVHNPLLFNFDSQGKRGVVAEVSQLLDDFLGEEMGRVRSPTIVVIPVARDELIPKLVEGRGDIVMANLTITPERQQLVDFTPPLAIGINELVITGPETGAVESFDDLVDIGLYLRRSSSYYEHVLTLNAERETQGKKPIPIIDADENLEDYDLLDMINAGALQATVVDSHKAEFWTKIFDDIVVHKNLKVHEGREIAWAIRKNSPELSQSIGKFSKTVKRGTLLGNILYRRYLHNTRWIQSFFDEEDQQTHAETIEVIKRFASEYNFDWLMIVAQAYQESQFDHSRVSHAGAVGLMQVLPTTAADRAVNIPDISSLENNVHAGVKYLNWLRQTYYSDPAIAPLDQVLFSFAAYNAGPGNMRKARRRAESMGLDRNEWFGNVEVGMYRSVSGEPAAYVRNIYKYYVAYQNLERTRVLRAKARSGGEN